MLAEESSDNPHGDLGIASSHAYPARRDVLCWIWVNRDFASGQE